MKIKTYPTDLKRIISAVILLAIKDLDAYNFAIIGSKCSMEVAKTAWLFIFSDQYRMLLGNVQLSLIDMLGIISNIQSHSLTKKFRVMINNKIGFKENPTINQG